MTQEEKAAILDYLIDIGLLSKEDVREAKKAIALPALKKKEKTT